MLVYVSKYIQKFQEKSGGIQDEETESDQRRKVYGMSGV